MRQHTSAYAYVRIRQKGVVDVDNLPYVSIRQHTSAYVSIRECVCECVCVCVCVCVCACVDLLCPEVARTKPDSRSAQKKKYAFVSSTTLLITALVLSHNLWRKKIEGKKNAYLYLDKLCSLLSHNLWTTKLRKIINKINKMPACIVPKSQARLSRFAQFPAAWPDIRCIFFFVIHAFFFYIWCKCTCICICMRAWENMAA
jgi:hypothetical protein